MLSFEKAVPPRPPGDTKNYRKRICGVMGRDCVIYSVASLNKTELVLVDQKGSSTTIMAFNHYMDIVTADLSDDNEMIAFTERIYSAEKSAFRTVLIHIHSFSNVKVCEDASPIVSFFVPSGTSDVYQIIHVVGPKVRHCAAKLLRARQLKIEVKQIRTGVNIPSCMKWFYSKIHHELYVAHGKDRLNVFRFSAHGMQTFGHDFPLNEFSILPPELALLPSIPRQLPVYGFSLGHFIGLAVENDYAIIEQLYKGEDSSLTFCLHLVSQKYRKEVSFPNTEPDLPLNFVCHDLLVFAFAVNTCMAMIDLNCIPPTIYVLPKCMCAGPTTNCTASLRLSNVIVDIEDGSVYHTSISVNNIPDSISISDRTILSILATITAALPNHVCISWLMNRLVDDHLSLVCFFYELFDVGMTFRFSGRRLKRASLHMSLSEIRKRTRIPESVLSDLDELELEFPSAGPVSRQRYFFELAMRLKRTGIGMHIVTQKVMRHLKLQNRLALSLRAGIDDWLRQYNPPVVIKFYVLLLILCESYFVPSPAIPCLRQEIEDDSFEICTPALRRQLVESRLIGVGYHSNNIPSREKHEIEYWNDRLPADIFVEGEEQQSSDSTFRARMSMTSSAAWFRSDISPSTSTESSAMDEFSV